MAVFSNKSHKIDVFHLGAVHLGDKTKWTNPKKSQVELLKQSDLKFNKSGLSLAVHIVTTDQDRRGVAFCTSM